MAAKKKTTKKTTTKKKTTKKSGTRKKSTKESEQLPFKKDPDEIVSALRTKHGQDAVMRLGERPILRPEVIPSGSIGVDLATGIGGIPRGRIIEVYGAESSGKTTLALHLIAEAQKRKGVCAFVDAEHALDPTYANALGVDTDQLIISQPGSGEEALEITNSLVSTSAVDVVVVDSVAALVPKAELEGEMGDAHMGKQARLMSQAMRKLTGIISKANTTVVFINQTRMKIGVLFGSPLTTTGGNALKFYASMRLQVSRISAIKSGDESLGNMVRVTVVKNKLAPPFRTAEFPILYGKGVSRIDEIFDFSIDLGFIDKKGAWFSYGDQRLGQGRRNALAAVQEDPELLEYLEQKVLEHLTP